MKSCLIALANTSASPCLILRNDIAHKLHTNCTQVAHKTAHKDYFSLLYFTLLGTLSSVCTISFAATNSANRRVTAYLSFSCSLRRALASLLLIVSIESRYRSIASFCRALSCFFALLTIADNTNFYRQNRQMHIFSHHK